MVLQTHRKPQQKNLALNRISLYRNYRWQTVFPFLLPGSIKKKTVDTGIPLQHGYVSKLLTLKTDVQYL